MKSLSIITATDYVRYHEGAVLEVFASTGHLRERVKCVNVDNSTMTVRGLRWHESLWCWMKRNYRKVLRWVAQ